MKASRRKKDREDRRPPHFWAAFNEWSRSYQETSGKRPRVEQMRQWWDKNAKTAFPEGEGPPTFEETKKHAKGVRTKDAIKVYFRGYRLRCKVAGARAKAKGRSAKGAAEDTSLQVASPQSGRPASPQSGEEDDALLAARLRRPVRARAKPKRLQSPGADTSDTSMSSIETDTGTDTDEDDDRGAARAGAAHLGGPRGPAFYAAQGGVEAAEDNVEGFSGGVPSSDTGTAMASGRPGESPRGIDGAARAHAMPRLIDRAGARSPGLLGSWRPQEAEDVREQDDGRQPSQRQLRSPCSAPESTGPLVRRGQRTGRRSLQLPPGEALEDRLLMPPDLPLGMSLERAVSQRDEEARTAAELLLQRVGGVSDAALTLPPSLPPPPPPEAPLPLPLPRTALAPICVNPTITTATHSTKTARDDDATDAYAALRSFPMRDNVLGSLAGLGNVFGYGACHISSAIPPVSATAAIRSLPYEPRKTPAKRVCTTSATKARSTRTEGLAVQGPAAGEAGSLSRGNSLQLQQPDRSGTTSRGAGCGEGKDPTPGPGRSRFNDPLWEIEGFSPSLLLALGAKPPESVLRLTGAFGSVEGDGRAAEGDGRAAAASAWVPGRTPHTLIRSSKMLQEELERSNSLDASGLEWLAGLPLGDAAGLEQILMNNDRTAAARAPSPRPAESADRAEQHSLPMQQRGASPALLRHQIKQEPVEEPVWVPTGALDRRPDPVWRQQQPQQQPAYQPRDYGQYYGAAQGQYGVGLALDSALSDLYALPPPHDYYGQRRAAVQQAADMRMPPPAHGQHYGHGPFGPHMGMFQARGHMRTDPGQQRLPPYFYPQQQGPPAFLPANAVAPARGYPADGSFGGFPQLGSGYMPNGRAFPA